MFCYRLVSAYEDKKYKLIDSLKKLKSVSFPKFITEVFAAQDSHFTPLYEVCKYCFIRYDFIGRIEKYDEDIQYVAEKNNFTYILNMEKADRLNAAEVHQNITQTGALGRNQKVTYYFSQLSKSLLSRIKQHYRVDFEMFGYDPHYYSH